MNRERMRVWVDALKNDTDGQCIGELVDMNGCHCALGVGIVASGKTPSIERTQYDQIEEFCEWLECDALDLCITVNGVSRGVMELNDKLRLPLAEIGELIEAQHLSPAP